MRRLFKRLDEVKNVLQVERDLGKHK
jgi:hypothetical protein